jgi:hypothetical protein
MKRHYLLLATLATLALHSEGAGADTETMFGEGTRPCSEWSAAHQEPYSARAVRQEAWASGYMSAYNNFIARIGISQTTFEGMPAWLTRYCESHSLDPIADAVVAFAAELQAREKSK